MAELDQLHESSHHVKLAPGLDHQEHMAFVNKDLTERLLSAEREDSDRNSGQISVSAQNGNHGNDVVIAEDASGGDGEVVVVNGIEEPNEGTEQIITIENGVETLTATEISEVQDRIAVEDESELILIENGGKIEPEVSIENASIVIVDGDVPQRSEEIEIINSNAIVVDDSNDSSTQVLVQGDGESLVKVAAEEILEEDQPQDDSEHVLVADDHSVVKVADGTVATPRVELLDGNMIPAIALGTWMIAEEDLNGVIGEAIDSGYRHIDCAYVHQNQEAVGAALGAKLEEGKVSRNELFITSKLWATEHRPQGVESACKRTLEELGLDYLDLYLMHTPFGFKGGKGLIPKIAGVIQYDMQNDFLQTWYAMENLVKIGLVRSIGVANFNSVQIAKLWTKAKIKPVVNQIECHPYLNQKRLIELCQSLEIVVSAYGVLGSPFKPTSRDTLEPSLVEDDRIIAIADKYGKSTAQILQRYQVEKGNIFIVKSTNLTHIHENIEAFSFSLEPEDFQILDNIKRVKRYIDFAGMGDTHRDYPFNIPF